MQAVRLTDVREALAPSALTLGNLDGVHRGHQRLVQELLRAAAEDRLVPVVATFVPHPAQVLRPERAPNALMSLEQKVEALTALGVERVVAIEFTAALAALAPETFVRQIMVGQLGVRSAVVGPGFRFGSGRAGDVALLRRLGEELGFQVHEVAPVLVAGGLVSSTRVREALASGDVTLARELLGRPFANEALVVAGDGRGRQLGIPTANLAPFAETMPADGVYAAWCLVHQGPRGWGTRHSAVVSVGRRPTFAGRERRVEVHLLDFSGELYGARLRVDYWARLRAEQRFSDAQALSAQMRADVEQARRALEAG
jgi:riboflavin kinase / FMN adenylyltransferase